MSLITKDLLINFMLIITPIFLVNLYIMERKFNLSEEMIKRVMIVVFSVCIILALSFSFELSKGLIFDFRTIPFIFGLLYGGPRMGAILLVVLLSYRFAIGGEGVWAVLVTYLILYVSGCFTWKHYQEMSIRKRYLTTIGFMLLTVLLLFISTAILFGSFAFFDFVFWLNFTIIHVVGVIIFIHLIEMMLQNYQLKNEMIRNEKSEVISQLAASIAHEVRNPLTTTSGVIQLLLKDEVKDEEKRKELLKLAKQELNQAESVISDYLLVARPYQNKVETLSMDEILYRSIEIIRPMANMNNVNIVSELENNCYVTGEVQKLHQSFLNLLKNGIEAMTNGGTLTVKCKIIKGQSKVQITIADTGIGMSKHQIECIGDPYYSTKENGTGLGMMVVYRIIEGMGGKIKVYSELEKGTEFKIHLPQTN